MTTRTILTDTRDYLDTLLDGYNIRFFRWTDADEEGQSPFALLRFPSDGGPSDELLQQFDVQVTLVQQPSGAVAGHDDMSAILARVREGGSQGSVLRFEPLGNMMGPMYLENGRPVWTLNVRCYTEGY